MAEDYTDIRDAVGKLCAQGERGGGRSSFTSTLRVFIIEHYRTAVAALRPCVQIGVGYEPAVAPRAVTAQRTRAPAVLRTR